MFDFVVSVFREPVFVVLSKVIFTSYFWVSGFIFLLDFNKSVTAMKTVGLPMPTIFSLLTITLQISGSALIITNFMSLGWLGASCLAIFTALTVPLSYPFWKYTGEERLENLYNALEHLTVIGGLMLIAAISLS